jgi:hypothetical protein
MKRGTRLLLSGFLFVVELSIVVGLVVGVAFGLTRWAEHRANLPIRPDNDGVVSLPAPRASLHGQLAFFPTDVEKRTEGYGVDYGRELAKERANRKIGDWRRKDDYAQWSFRLDQLGTYEVALDLAAPDDIAGSEYEMTIGVKSLSGTVPATGGWEAWKTVPVGRVELPAGTHVLAITPREIKHGALMNLARVTLRPAAASK